MARRKKSRSASRQVFAKRRNTFILVGAVALLAFWLFGTRFMTIARLVKQKNDLSAQLAEEKARSVRLDESVGQVGSRHYIEYIAHKSLNLYYPDERIIVQVKRKGAKNASK